MFFSSIYVVINDSFFLNAEKCSIAYAYHIFQFSDPLIDT
jgi:hypothetical protein